MNNMLTFNEYEDMVEKEFIKRRLKQERTYTRIVLFEKYSPSKVIDDYFNLTTETTGTWE